LIAKAFIFQPSRRKESKMPHWAFLIFFTLSFTVGNVTAQDDDDNMDSIFLKLVQQQETIHSTPAPILDPILEEANNSLIQAEADVPKPTPSTPGLSFLDHQHLHLHHHQHQRSNNTRASKKMQAATTTTSMQQTTATAQERAEIHRLLLNRFRSIFLMSCSTPSTT